MVLEGRHRDLTWRVRASGDDRAFTTMLHVYRDGRLVAASGMGRPKLYPGELINEWRGRTDELPYFVMVRADPAVERVVAVTEQGSEVELGLSPVVTSYGLRFAAAGLPDGERPGRPRVTASVGAAQSRPSGAAPGGRGYIAWLFLVVLGDVAQWPQGGVHGRDEAEAAVHVEVGVDQR